MDDHLSGTPVTQRLNAANPSVVTRRAISSLLFGLAPDGVYRAAPVSGKRGGLLPHRFTLARSEIEISPVSGLFSVALSVGSPRLGVTQHPALWSSDFPHPNGRGHPAHLPFFLPQCPSLRACPLPGFETEARAES